MGNTNLKKVSALLLALILGVTALIGAPMEIKAEDTVTTETVILPLGYGMALKSDIINRYIDSKLLTTGGIKGQSWNLSEVTAEDGWFTATYEYTLVSGYNDVFTGYATAEEVEAMRVQESAGTLKYDGEIVTLEVSEDSDYIRVEQLGTTTIVIEDYLLAEGKLVDLTIPVEIIAHRNHLKSVWLFLAAML